MVRVSTNLKNASVDSAVKVSVGGLSAADAIIVRVGKGVEGRVVIRSLDSFEIDLSMLRVWV